MRKCLLVLVCLALFIAFTDAQFRVGLRHRANPPEIPPQLAVAPATLPNGTEGVAYTCTAITATGGSGTYSWSVIGTLPTGVTITDSGSNTAVCGGTAGATSAGTYPITLVVTDTSTPQQTAQRDVTIIILDSTDPLPMGWTSTDVGTPGAQAGTVAYNSGTSTWTLTSWAWNIIGTSDSFRDACMTQSGDGQITARVASFTGYTFAQAGVQIRASRDVDAPFKFSFVMPAANGNSNQHKVRDVAGASMTNLSTGLSSHFWVRVSRSGNLLTGYYSTSGADGSWVAFDSRTIVMSSQALYCLTVTSIANQTPVASATFDNVTVESGLEQPPTLTDYGGLRPSYQGFGATTLGGRGDTTKRTCAVNSLLNTSGAPTLVDGGTQFYRGTFRQCAMGLDSSFIVCEVSGNIDIGLIDITLPYLTVAMQTCPSPGVTLRNGYFTVNTHDVAFQHVRLRCGAASGAINNKTEGFYTKGQNAPVYNVVYDHVTVTWCWHTGIGMHAFGGTNTIQPEAILVTDTIIAEHFAVNPSSLCNLLFGTTNGTITYARSYHVNCGSRNPWIGSGWRGDFYNNVTVGAKTGTGGDGKFGFVQVVGETGYPRSLIEIAYIGNVNIAGPSTISPDGTIGVHMDSTQVTTGGGAKLYMRDNTGPGITNNGTFAGQQSGVFFVNAANASNTMCNQACFDSTFTWTQNYKYEILENADVTAHVIANVGARPTERDTVDTRLIGYITTPSGSNADWGDHESDVGGFPSIATCSSNCTFTMPATPYANGTCGTVVGGASRLVIECTLENEARALEPRW